MTQSLAQLPEEHLKKYATGAKLVPFDQVVTLVLKGEADNIVRAVTNISVEGQFVATAIGYSLLSEPQAFGPVDPEPPPVVVQSMPTVSLQLPQVVLRIEFDEESQMRQGFAMVFGNPAATVEISYAIGTTARPNFISDTVILPESGQLTIEEPIFQVDPSRKKGIITVKDLTHNIAGPPIDFTVGEGRKVQTSVRFGDRLPTFGQKGFAVKGPADTKVEINTQQRKPTDKLEITLDGKGFGKVNLPNPLALGSAVVISAKGSTVRTRLQLTDDIFKLSLATIPSSFLRNGFRVNSRVLQRLESGVPVPPEELETPFEPCGTADLSFLYTITDLGSGRELQNEPIHNIAGLGIANGDRPFRIFPKPIVFKPRSVIQFEVREISGGPGKLYFVLQGYKVLGAGSRSMEV